MKHMRKYAHRCIFLWGEGVGVAHKQAQGLFYRFGSQGKKVFISAAILDFA